MTVLGDGAGAAAPITPSPGPFSSPGLAPGGVCSVLRTPVPISAKAVTHPPGLCTSPRPHPAGLRTWPEPGSPQVASCCLCGGPRCRTTGSTAGAGLRQSTACPRPGHAARGKIYRLSELGPEVSRGQKVHFGEVTVHFFQSNEAIICESSRFAGYSLEAEQGTATGSERTGRSPLPFRICHSTGPKNKYTTHRNMTRGCCCCGAVSPELGEMRLGCKGTLPGRATLRDVAASLGWKVTEDGQKLGDAEKLAAEFK